jgi:hypothetical protein
MTNREAFDIWHSQGGFDSELHLEVRDAMWDAWQAATAAEREACAKECLERRGHFASDYAAQAFADILRGTK